MPKFTKRDVRRRGARRRTSSTRSSVDPRLRRVETVQTTSLDAAGERRGIEAMGNEDDAAELDEMERLTRALDPPARRSSPPRAALRHPEEEAKDLRAGSAPCPVEQRKWSHSGVESLRLKIWPRARRHGA